MLDNVLVSYLASAKFEGLTLFIKKNCSRSMKKLSLFVTTENCLACFCDGELAPLSGSLT